MITPPRFARPLCASVFTLATFLAPTATWAQEHTKMNSDQPVAAGQKSNLALKGYDVVSYFDQQKAMKGTSSYTAQHEGATYWFTSAAHRDSFVKEPAQYLPQYGGFCAYGASKGHKAPADPEAWTVVDGKLYLNYNKEVQKRFAKDTDGAIKEADKYWQKQ